MTLLARKRLRLSAMWLGIAISLGKSVVAYAVEDIQFNTDILDVNDRKNIDLSLFSRRDFIMPGTYNMVIHINKTDLPEQHVTFIAPDNDPKGSEACLAPDLVAQLGLKDSVAKSVSWLHNGKCLDISKVKGMEVRGDLGSSALYISVPQAYLEYTSENWDPPSRWDNGIPGLLLDYNVNGQTQKPHHGERSYSVSGNGTAGFNLMAWRLRADWQANWNHQGGKFASTTRQFDWNRYYAYRAIPALLAKLTVGESYLDSGIFDGFRFAGASLRSDDSMIPPALRGYAPEVTGVAKTNAHVVIRQQGRVLYETQVASGPFRIQDISDAISGELDVRVEEQDGSVQEFKVNTANIPYLTRPGAVRYRLAVGKPSEMQHHMRGPWFGTGEFSWGVSNGWSLYGGSLIAGDYNALSLGIGRDLMALGALSFDATQSWARIPRLHSSYSGGSYRVSYSKTFDEYDSQITFAGYRFSERDFMSMSEYLDARFNGTRVGNSKEMYTVTLNKQFRDLGLTTYVNFNHQTYWDRASNDRYNLTLSRYFDFWRFKNLSLSVSAYRTRYEGSNDDGMYLSLTVPWGDATLSYNLSASRHETNQTLGYYDRLNEHDNYQLNAGDSRQGANLSGYFNHDGDIASLTANAGYQHNGYSALGLSAQGGMTLTTKGGALHRSAIAGGTRLLVDTDGVADVPVRGYGSTIDTNYFGKAVISDVNSYYRNQASIDLDKLNDNVEATQSVVQATLTEGAIGYRRFSVIAGEKAMAVIRLADGSMPPFGATVLNANQQETGIVNDNGQVYLSGIRPGDAMSVRWNGQTQCEIRIPAKLPVDLQTRTLLLPCRPLTGDAQRKENATAN